jgi:hypothetical protein
MKNKTLLHMGLLLLYVAIATCCKSNTDHVPQTTQTFISPETSLSQNEVPKQTTTAKIVAGSEVYVCKSSGAKRYHLSKACKGLGRCSHTIEKTTKKEAEAMGLTLCKWED